MPDGMIAAHNHSGAAHNERTKRRRIPRARVIFITIDSLLRLSSLTLLFFTMVRPIHFLLPPSLSYDGNTVGIHRRICSRWAPTVCTTIALHEHDLKVTRLTCIPARTSLLPVCPFSLPTHFNGWNFAQFLPL